MSERVEFIARSQLYEPGDLEPNDYEALYQSALRRAERKCAELGGVLGPIDESKDFKVDLRVRSRFGWNNKYGGELRATCVIPTPEKRFGVRIQQP